jgi:hypothetical protein
MSEKQGREEPSVDQAETVRCLSCGALYAKPSSGGTVPANPGCPECEYMGWVLASSLTPREPRRSSEDRPQRR